MAVRRRSLSYTSSILLAIFLALGNAALAQLPGSPAAPRPGTVYQLEVALPDAAALQALEDVGYNITHVSDEAAEIYATPAERDRLLADGYSVDTLSQQPAPMPGDAAAKGLGVYHNYAALTGELQAYAAAFPSISRLISLGQSVEGRELWALLITDNPDTEEDEPEFKYVCTMHGDERVGTEMILYLIDRMLNDYGSDSRITDLVNETAIWFVPLMNPDGRENGTRANANGFDLNRNFPTFPINFNGNIFDGAALDASGRPPEVQHLMYWTVANSFVLSGNTHGGALVVNYPYDNDIGILSGQDAPSPDDLLFEDLSLRYSINNPPMFASFAFPDGITNGSEWFSITGGMQDWNYRYMSCFDVTLELSIVKTPAQSTLATFWANNEESMLSYLEAVHIGVRGIVREAQQGKPLWAKVTVAGNSQPVFTDADVGDYHRLLLPGVYDLTFSAPDYFDKTFTGIVIGSGSATRLDVYLQPINPVQFPAASRLGLVLLVVFLVGLFIWTKQRRASG